ncbi:hypothetical protein Q9Q94_15500 [Uliginosibacterium sp. 31-16]|uniref:hypothetical protein n=1 Tax=Uliginosibacterium sp. 31-16 TaxID=3068315 RepID=UPI00273FA656|nr:hypothetical protein [Uliginosibacterium sp. 31-16]MDP5240947.1 hypothetical protein [Uliginosibacterium sp. 31-16]
MSAEQKKRVHLCLASIALKQWEKAIASGLVPLSYQETVTGTLQDVEELLPAEALVCIVEKTDPTSISARFLEPTCASGDEDWHLADEPMYAYLTIYNAFQKYALGKDIDDWMIVNQALSSLGTPTDETHSVFEMALNEAA